MPIAQTQSPNWWDDPHFQDNLVALLITDHKTLRDVSAFLTPEDFRPQKGVVNGWSRWIVAERALEFFHTHHEPLGKMLRADVLQYASELDLGASRKGELNAYVDRLKTLKITAPDATVDKVIKFKSRILKKAAIEELVELHASGQLTDDKWREISQKALAATRASMETISYADTLEARIERRALNARNPKIPWTFIDPLDAMVHTVGPKQLGMVLAPYKRGKSMFMRWLAVAFARQRLDTLLFTLEDPADVVTDDFDSIISHIPQKSLGEYPKTLTKRFTRFKGMTRAGIEVYDGTEEEVTVDRIEQIYLRKREEGFTAKAVLVDYDEEIRPSRKFSEKRFETDDTYRGLRRFMARYGLIGWVAAQTQRDTRHLKILSGDKVAEDIGKMRKVTCGISMGKGDWTEDSIYLWIAAHKTDRMECGCEIVPDMKARMIYDEEATRRAYLANAAQETP